MNISVTARAQRTSAQVPQGVDPDDPLFQFFKRFGPQFQGPQNAQPQNAQQQAPQSTHSSGWM